MSDYDVRAQALTSAILFMSEAEIDASASLIVRYAEIFETYLLSGRSGKEQAKSE